MAVFALGVMLASAASAQTQGKLTTENGENVTFTTEELELGAESLNALGMQVRCPGSEYTGHKYNVTPHVFVPNNAETVTLTPHYNQANCKVVGTYPATITMNECDYVLHIGSTTGEQTLTKKTYGATIDIVCPQDQPIKIEVWESGQDHETVMPWCTIEILSQAGLIGGHISSTPFNDDLDLGGTVTGITAFRHGSKPVLCANGPTTSASIVLNSTVTADNEDARGVGITVTD